MRLALAACLVGFAIFGLEQTTAADEPKSVQESALAASAQAASVKELAAKVRDSIVVVTYAGREGNQQGLGTGFVIDKRGLIATNLHVIGEARPIEVRSAAGKKLAGEGRACFGSDARPGDSARSTRASWLR